MSLHVMIRPGFIIRLFAGALIAQGPAINAFAGPRITAKSEMEAAGSCNYCIRPALDRVGMDSAQQQTKDILQYIAVFGPDDRIPQTRRPVGGHGTGYSAIGRIYTNRIFRGGLHSAGTAFLVSPCVAMTNYHVLFGDESIDKFLPYAKELNRQFKENRDRSGNVKITLPNDVNFSMTFLVGEKPDGTGTFKRQAVGRPIAFGNIDKQGGVAFDWVAIEFDEPNCPGSDPEIGWLDLDASAQTKIDQMDLQTAGYAGVHNHLIALKGMLDRSSRPCHSYGQRLEQEAMAHDCPSTDGQSGGPIFYVKDGKFEVVGINRGPAINQGDEMMPNYDRRSRDFEKYANEAVGVQAFLPEVLPIITKDLADHGLGPLRQQ
jgi:V8-like Glu-specific endopeptidase